MSRLYGIRGATTVLENSAEAILQGTKELLANLLEKNRLYQDDIVSIIFTTTPDLTADFPAKAARELGLDNIALLGAVEAAVPHGLPHCIRVLVHAYLEPGLEVKHVYLKDAVKLRPDINHGSDL